MRGKPLSAARVWTATFAVWIVFFLLIGASGAGWSWEDGIVGGIIISTVATLYNWARKP